MSTRQLMALHMGMLALAQEYLGSCIQRLCDSLQSTSGLALTQDQPHPSAVKHQTQDPLGPCPTHQQANTPTMET